MAHSENFQLNTFRSYVTILADSKSTDDKKLRAAQELSENFEVVVQSSSYPSFLEHSLKAFMHFLQDGEPQFIQEYQAHQVKATLPPSPAGPFVNQVHLCIVFYTIGA